MLPHQRPGASFLRLCAVARDQRGKLNHPVPRLVQLVRRHLRVTRAKAFLQSHFFASQLNNALACLHLPLRIQVRFNVVPLRIVCFKS